MTERGMREVVAGSLWQQLWPSENGSFVGSRRENPKQGRRQLVFISGRDKENLGLSVPFFYFFFFLIKKTYYFLM